MLEVHLPYLLDGMASEVKLGNQPLGPEGIPEHGDTGVGIGLPTHKDIQSGIPILRPGMDGDVAFGQDGNS